MEIPSQLNMFSKNINYDLDIYIEQLKNCFPLQECQLKNICEKVIFQKNNNKILYIILYIF